jgi:hypothetical protein
MSVEKLLRTVSAVEFDLWLEWYQFHGFDADRGEWAAAAAGARVANALGARTKARDLVPKFGPKSPTDTRLVRTWLESPNLNAERWFTHVRK